MRVETVKMKSCPYGEMPSVASLTHTDTVLTDAFFFTLSGELNIHVSQRSSNSCCCCPAYRLTDSDNNSRWCTKGVSVCLSRGTTRSHLIPTPPAARGGSLDHFLSCSEVFWRMRGSEVSVRLSVSGLGA